MAFCTNNHFLKITRDLWCEEYQSLSVNAKWLFICLNEAEQRFCDKPKKFYLSNSKLALLSGLSINIVKRAKQELIEHAMGIIYIESEKLKKEDIDRKEKILKPTKYTLLK